MLAVVRGWVELPRICCQIPRWNPRSTTDSKSNEKECFKTKSNFCSFWQPIKKHAIWSQTIIYLQLFNLNKTSKIIISRYCKNSNVAGFWKNQYLGAQKRVDNFSKKRWAFFCLCGTIWAGEFIWYYGSNT